MLECSFPADIVEEHGNHPCSNMLFLSQRSCHSQCQLNGPFCLQKVLNNSMVIIHLELAFPFHMNDASSNGIVMDYLSPGEMKKPGLKEDKCSAING